MSSIWTKRKDSFCNNENIRAQKFEDVIVIDDNGKSRVVSLLDANCYTWSFKIVATLSGV